MLTHIKSAIHSTDGMAGDRALSASGTAPSRQGQALSLDVQNDSSAAVFVLGTSPRSSAYRRQLSCGFGSDGDVPQAERLAATPWSVKGH